MALLTPKMSLRLWEQLNDPYSHDQLADNFSKIDFHDHSPGRGNQVPTEGLFDGAVSGLKIDPSVLFPWRNVAVASGFHTAALAAGTYALAAQGNGVAAGSWASALPFFHIDPADLTITGRTTQFRVKASVYTNATAPGVTFTAGLYPLGTLSGGAGALNNTIGSLVTNSFASISPAAASANAATSAGFTLTAGHYLLAFATNGTTVASSHTGVRLELQVHNI